jgi:hypothetical protein
MWRQPKRVVPVIAQKAPLAHVLVRPDVVVPIVGVLTLRAHAFRIAALAQVGGPSATRTRDG